MTGARPASGAGAKRAGEAGKVRQASGAGGAPGGRLVIPAGQGEAHVVIDRPPGAPRFLLALTHGAGGGVETADLLAARDAALALGGTVARIVQPYQVRGARSPGSAARQDEAWINVVAAVRDMLREEMPGEAPRSAPAGAGRAGVVPLVQGGRSNGARLACRTAGEIGAGAVIALAFPLHPPGRPERSRRDELRMATATGADVLVVNGSRDPFGVPEPADAGAAGAASSTGTARIVVLDGEGHALSRDPAAVGAAVSPWLSGWLHDHGALPDDHGPLPADGAVTSPRS